MLSLERLLAYAIDRLPNDRSLNELLAYTGSLFKQTPSG
jgi:hypothetical protein